VLSGKAGKKTNFKVFDLTSPGLVDVVTYLRYGALVLPLLSNSKNLSALKPSAENRTRRLALVVRGETCGVIPWTRGDVK
jgi:hypothetical protein